MSKRLIHFKPSRCSNSFKPLSVTCVPRRSSFCQNYLTLAAYTERAASHYDRIMNDALDRRNDYVSDTTKRRVASVTDKLLRYLLFADEFTLAAPVRGSSTFTQEFQSVGPHDSQGRSLRDFDLEKRLFRYPCSYLICSPAIDHLPKLVKQYTKNRLHDILAGSDTSHDFAYLSASQRQAILEILTETKPDLWK